MTYRIGFIGTGDPEGDGYAMAYRHAEGYRRLDSCHLAACADIVPENARAFAKKYEIPESRIFQDYTEMLESCQIDIVSVCVPPAKHAEIVTTAAEVGELRGIHCEKPMALTWGGAKRMVATCRLADVQLTVNHQLQLGEPYRAAKRTLDENRVGELERIEFRAETLYDNGTHSFAIANYYADHSPVEWVLGQVDYREEHTLFGAHNENQALSQWQYESGVYGLASTGRDGGFLDPIFRLTGSEGCIEVYENGTTAYRTDGGSWQEVETGLDGRYWPESGRIRRGLELAAGVVSDRLAAVLETPNYTERAIEEIITAIETDTKSVLDADYALAADELVFATWESARRRGRVDLPLDIEDNPLEAMIESGALDPAPAEDATQSETTLQESSQSEDATTSGKIPTSLQLLSSRFRN